MFENGDYLASGIIRTVNWYGWPYWWNYFNGIGRITWKADARPGPEPGVGLTIGTISGGERVDPEPWRSGVSAGRAAWRTVLGSCSQGIYKPVASRLLGRDRVLSSYSLRNLLKWYSSWYSHWFLIVFSWVFSWCSLGVLLVFSWCSLGVLLVFSWCSLGVLLVFRTYAPLGLQQPFGVAIERMPGLTSLVVSLIEQNRSCKAWVV